MGMRLGRRFTALAFALSLLGMLVLSPSVHALSFGDDLRSWEATSWGVQQPGYLKLEVSEAYPSYLFHVEPPEGVPLATVVVEVQTLNGDLVCRGLVTYTFDTLNMVQHCRGLRLGHQYFVHWMTDVAGTQLFLSGVE